MFDSEREDQIWLEDCGNFITNVTPSLFTESGKETFIHLAAPLFRQMKKPMEMMVVPEAPQKKDIEMWSAFSKAIDGLANRAEIVTGKTEFEEFAEVKRRFDWLSNCLDEVDAYVGHSNWRYWLPMSNKKVFPNNLSSVWDEEMFSLYEEKGRTPGIDWALGVTKGCRGDLPPWYSIGIVFGDYNEDLVNEYFEDVKPEQWRGRMTSAAIADALCSASGSIAMSRNTIPRVNKIFNFLEKQDVAWDHVIKPTLRGLVGNDKVNEIIIQKLASCVSNSFLLNKTDGLKPELLAFNSGSSEIIEDNIDIFNRLSLPRLEKLKLQEQFLKEHNLRPTPTAL